MVARPCVPGPLLMVEIVVAEELQIAVLVEYLRRAVGKDSGGGELLRGAGRGNGSPCAPG